MVRVRPLLEHEAVRGANCVVECGPPDQGGGSLGGTGGSIGSTGGGGEGTTTLTTYKYVSIRAHAKLTLRCKYDHVFGPEASQSHVYQRVKAGVKRVLDGAYNGVGMDLYVRIVQSNWLSVCFPATRNHPTGYNSTVMAYGQTGSGKTHSMFGSPGSYCSTCLVDHPFYAQYNPPSSHTGYATTTGRATPQLPDGAGIISRAIADIFTTVRRREAAQLPPIAIYCSFVQIYNEQVGVLHVCVCVAVSQEGQDVS